MQHRKTIQFPVARCRSADRMLLTVWSDGALSPVASVQAKNARYNSNNQLPRNQYLADVDGDSEIEFVQLGKKRLFSFETDFEHSGRLHYYSRVNLKNLIVGAFREWSHSTGRHLRQTEQAYVAGDARTQSLRHMYCDTPFRQPHP